MYSYVIVRQQSSTYTTFQSNNQSILNFIVTGHGIIVVNRSGRHCYHDPVLCQRDVTDWWYHIAETSNTFSIHITWFLRHVPDDWVLCAMSTGCYWLTVSHCRNIEHLLDTYNLILTTCPIWLGLVWCGNQYAKQRVPIDGSQTCWTSRPRGIHHEFVNDSTTASNNTFPMPPPQYYKVTCKVVHIDLLNMHVKHDCTFRWRLQGHPTINIRTYFVGHNLAAPGNVQIMM